MSSLIWNWNTFLVHHDTSFWYYAVWCQFLRVSNWVKKLSLSLALLFFHFDSVLWYFSFQSYNWESQTPITNKIIPYSSNITYFLLHFDTLLSDFRVLVKSSIQISWKKLFLTLTILHLYPFIWIQENFFQKQHFHEAETHIFGHLSGLF